MAELFSALPPLEAFKLLASLLPTIRKNTPRRPLRFASCDVSHAHFNGKPKRMLYIHLLEEEAVPSKCGLLLRAMGGTRNVSNTWLSDYTGHLGAAGFLRGWASPATFGCAGHRGIRARVHEGDSAALADDEGLAFLEKTLTERYEYRCMGRLGGGIGRSTDCHFLKLCGPRDGNGGRAVCGDQV